MNTQHATPAAKSKKQTAFARALDQEVCELDTIHAGLVRHMNAWRGANDAALARAESVMARMDVMIERLEARRQRG